MEHNICDVLAKRMKGRKMSWSISGADNLAKNYRKNLEIDYLILWIKFIEILFLRKLLII